MFGKSLRFSKTHQSIAGTLETLTARRHFQDARAELSLGRRNDLRIRLGQAMILVLESEGLWPITLENLSLGGVGLTGAPKEWVRDWPVAFSLCHRGERLPVKGRVVWRRKQTVGVAFLRQSPEQDLQVRRFLSGLLAGQS